MKYSYDRFNTTFRKKNEEPHASSPDWRDVVSPDRSRRDIYPEQMGNKRAHIPCSFPRSRCEMRALDRSPSVTASLSVPRTREFSVRAASAELPTASSA